MEVIKVKIKHEWIQGELVEKPEDKIEAVIFENKKSEKIISLDDMAFLTDISVQSLKNFIRNKHVVHYYIGQKWFVNIEDIWNKSERILE